MNNKTDADRLARAQAAMARKLAEYQNSTNPAERNAADHWARVLAAK